MELVRKSFWKNGRKKKRIFTYLYGNMEKQGNAIERFEENKDFKINRVQRKQREHRKKQQ